MLTLQCNLWSQDEAPFVGAILTDDGPQWYSRGAHAFSEATADNLKEAEQWVQTSFCIVRCSLPMHAEVMNQNLPSDLQAVIVICWMFAVLLRAIYTYILSYRGVFLCDLGSSPISF